MKRLTNDQPTDRLTPGDLADLAGLAIRDRKAVVDLLRRIIATRTSKREKAR